MGDVVCVLLLFVLLLAVPQLAFAQQDSNEQGASSTSVDVGAAALDPVVPAAAPQAPSAQSAVEIGDAPGADPATYSGGSEDVGAWANPGDVAGESSQGELGGGVDAVENPLGSEGFDNVEGEGGIEGEAGEGEGEGAVPGEDEPQTENDEGDSDKKRDSSSSDDKASGGNAAGLPGGSGDFVDAGLNQVTEQAQAAGDSADASKKETKQEQKATKTSYKGSSKKNPVAASAPTTRTPSASVVLVAGRLADVCAREEQSDVPQTEDDAGGGDKSPTRNKAPPAGARVFNESAFAGDLLEEISEARTRQHATQDDSVISASGKTKPLELWRFFGSAQGGTSLLDLFGLGHESPNRHTSLRSYRSTDNGFAPPFVAPSRACTFVRIARTAHDFVALLHQAFRQAFAGRGPPCS